MKYLFLLILSLASFSLYSEMPAEVIGTTCNVEFQLDPSTKTILVALEYSHLPAGTLHAEFRDFFLYANRQSGLSKRISNLSIDNAALTSEAPGIFAIDSATAIKTLRITYRFNPSKAHFDHHLVAWTRTTLHIPAEDILPTLFVSETGNDSQVYVSSTRYTIIGLPKDWISVNPYNEKDGAIVVDDRNWKAVLLSWGAYDTLVVPCENSTITLALDKAAMFINRKKIIDAAKEYFTVLPQKLGPLPSSNAVAILNWAPWGNATGGQAKKDIFIATMGWQYVFDARRLISLIFHEGFHLWNEQFHLNESVYWFTEGCAKYIELKYLTLLKYRTDKDLARQLLKMEQACKNIHEPLIEASRADAPTNDELQLQYNMGAVASWRLDTALREKNSSLEAFNRSLFGKYGVNGSESLDNIKLVDEINAALDDTSFTRMTLSER